MTDAAPFCLLPCLTSFEKMTIIPKLLSITEPLFQRGFASWVPDTVGPGIMDKLLRH